MLSPPLFFLLLSQMATGDPQGVSAHNTPAPQPCLCFWLSVQMHTFKAVPLPHSDPCFFPLGSSCEHKDLYLLPGLTMKHEPPTELITDRHGGLLPPAPIHSRLFPFASPVEVYRLQSISTDCKSKVEAGIGKEWMMEHRVGDKAKAAQ